MPAPRTCRACGAPLLPDVRWCGRCHEPVREFSARAPLHDGDFVATPRHTGGAAPHWSRWGKEATTFGPRGRVGITVTLVLFLVIGAFTQFLLLWLVEVIVGAWILKDVWRPAWVVPGEGPSAPATATGRPRRRLAVRSRRAYPYGRRRDRCPRHRPCHHDRAARREVRNDLRRRDPERLPLLPERDHSVNRPHASPRPPKRRERFWKSRIASYRYSRLKSGQNTGVNQSSE